MSETEIVKTMQVKVIYWGPGEAGKTTNFHRLKEIFARYQISNGFSIATTDDRTLWNDSSHYQFSLPMPHFRLDLVTQVVTTTGQERFLATREYILQNADGIIFVADSAPDKQDENIRSFEELRALTQRCKAPILIQLNKRDLGDAVDENLFLKSMELPVGLDKFGFRTCYPCIAIDKSNPIGVKEIFLDMVQKILRNKIVV